MAPPINVAYVIFDGDGCYLLDPKSSESSLGEAFATIDVLDALLLYDTRGPLGDFFYGATNSTIFVGTKFINLLKAAPSLGGEFLPDDLLNCSY